MGQATQPAAERRLPVVRFVTEMSCRTSWSAPAPLVAMLSLSTRPRQEQRSARRRGSRKPCADTFLAGKRRLRRPRQERGARAPLGTPAIGVLNFATPNSRSHEDAARNVLKALDVSMAPVVLHRYEAYRLANPAGLTVQEAEPECRAAVEIAALWDWVSAEAQLSTGANVHKGQHE